MSQVHNYYVGYKRVFCIHIWMHKLHMYPHWSFGLKSSAYLWYFGSSFPSISMLNTYTLLLIVGVDPVGHVIKSY